MGSAQSAKPSHKSLLDQNGNTKRGYVEARRSTGQRYIRHESVRALKPESRNANAFYGNNREEGNAIIDRDQGRNIKSSSNIGSSSKSNVSEKDDLMAKKAATATGEDEVVEGWPKWLTDNIPREVLRTIVPKSADSYVKIEKVGQGTYSNVYKARDKATGKIMALKKVRFDTSEPESIKFMAREIMILQKLDHPNIIKLQGLATSRMQYSIYLVFDYMQSDLARILSRPDERLTEPQVKCYMQQLLSGLQHCHEQGILHRDIKGSNLLIDRNGMLKIGDLGLANFFNPNPGGRRRHLTSRVVTLWYRAPELLLGSNDYGIGIDLWSAGCLMAEMLAGRPIMPGRTEVEQLHRIFKLCGTPSDDYYKRLKLSAALKPPQTYKSSFREAFRSFPSHSLGLLNTLLSLDPGKRGTASSALQNEFFHTSPLACDLSGLPVIQIEDDDHDPINERRKHRTSRPRRHSQSQREQRKKSSASDKSKADDQGSKEEVQKRVFSLEPGSSSTSTSSTSVKPSGKEKGGPHPLFPSPVLSDHIIISPRIDAHPKADKNIKDWPPVPIARGRHATNYNMKSDGTNGMNLVQRSASTREFRSLQNKNRLKLHLLDD